MLAAAVGILQSTVAFSYVGGTSRNTRIGRHGDIIQYKLGLVICRTVTMYLLAYSISVDTVRHGTVTTKLFEKSTGVPTGNSDEQPKEGKTNLGVLGRRLLVDVTVSIFSRTQLD